MKERINHKFSYSKIIMAISAVVILFSFSVFCFSPATDSDSVEGTLWAEAALESGRLLSPDFTYPYAIPFGGNLFILPFLAMFGVCQFTNSCGLLLFYITLILTATLFISSLTKDKFHILLGTALLIMAYRSAVGANQLHHILYYQLGHICFLGLQGSLFFVLKQQGGRKVWLAVCLYAIWAGANGLVTIVLSVVPVIVPLYALFLLGDKRIQWKSVLIILGATLLGLLLYKLSMRDIRESSYLEASGTFKLQSVKNWILNIKSLPKDWFGLFAIYSQLKTASGMINPAQMERFISIIAGTAVGVIPVCFLLGMKKHDPETRKMEEYILLSWLVIWVICLLQYIMFRGHEKRLLYNGLLGNFVLLAVLYINNEEKTVATKSNIIASTTRNNWRGPVSTVLLAAYAVSFVIGADWNFDTSLTNELQMNGLRNGVGTYWNSNYYTVQSGNQVKIRPVFVSGKDITPWLYNSSKSWYSERNAQGNDWFLLLSDDEYLNMQTGSDQLLLKESKKIIDLKGYHALVFSADQWGRLVWGYEYDFSDDTWSIGCNTENGKRAIMDGGISFGPYIWIPEKHVCRITIKGAQLTQAEIEIHSLADNISLIPKYETLSNEEIVFTVDLYEDIQELEVVIRNRIDDDFNGPVIIESEVIEVMAFESA